MRSQNPAVHLPEVQRDLLRELCRLQSWRVQIRIIVKGRTFTKPWAGRWVCTGCNCEWELDDTDEEPESHFMNCYMHFSMRCPTCGYRTVRRLMK